MGNFTHTQAIDLHTFELYEARPPQYKAGLVLIQEAFGVNHHIQSIADRYADEGYWVLAPSIYDRIKRNVQLSYTPSDIQKGLALMSQIDWETLFLDIQATIDMIASKSNIKIGMMGYCFGGTVTWRCAHRIPLSAAVCYYGGSIHDYALEKPRCPTLLHFGTKDASIPQEDVEEIRDLNPEVQIQTYSADHGFNCDERGSYDAESAALAQKRTLDFLAQHL